MNKKKILKLLVASSTIAGGLGLSTSAVQATEVNNNIKKDGLTQDTTKVSQRTLATIINVSSNLNVRSDAGINYDTIGYVCNNEEVEILSEKGDWYRISFNGREGYVSKKYVNVKGEDKKVEDSTKSLVKKGKAINVNSTLNIRQATDVNSSIVGTLKNGDDFEIISKSGEWYNIKSNNNIVGFVGAAYVQEITGNETTIENVIQTITEEHEESTYESKAPTEKGVVKVSGNLRVRNGASTSAGVIGYLLDGQTVNITGEVSGWYTIEFNGKVGYASKNYIQKGSSNTQTTPNVSVNKSGTSGKVVNISSSLNIRSGAGTGHSVVGTLHNDDTVSILEKSGDWYRISHNGVNGYVSAQYIQEISSSNNVAQPTSKIEDGSNVSVGQVVNVSSRLNIRSGAGTGHSIVGTVKNEEAVVIFGRDGDWYHICYDDVIGYVSAQYIQELTSSMDINELISGIEALESEIKTGKVVNISSSLNIRSGAGTGHSVVGTLHNSDTVSILEKSGDWYHISHNGVTGYVSAQYLQEVSSEGSSTSQASSRTLNKTGKVVNISSSLNIRSGAGTGYSIVGTLRNSETVSILEKSGDWYHINHNGVTGYVSAQYLQEVSGGVSTPEPAPTPAPVNKTGKVVNISSSLNIRSGAGTGHSIVGTLRNSDTVSILEKSGDWYHINHNGVTGYVSAQYLQEVSGGASTPAPVPVNKTGKVVNVSNYLNIRSGAGTGHSIVGILRNGETVSILEKSGDWYHIDHNGVKGYVSAEYLQEAGSGSSSNESSSASGQGYVYNVTSNLRVRAAASTSSLVLGYLRDGQSVNIVGTSNGWTHINYNGTTAYVSSDYIKTGSPASSSVDSTAIFNNVYSIMRAHVGSPYIWGGSGEYLTTSSLNALKSRFPGHNYSRAENYVNQGYRAFDCSGLMQWGFRQVGINIGRTTYDQIYNGHEVSLSNLQPGDLLFYGDLGHVGMYIGNGQWIEAPNSSSNVRVVSVPWSKVTRARRVIG